jgi:hypothetical protein
MTSGQWTYPVELLAALEGLGLSPTSATPPAVVRDALNDLYRYELRRMRDRQRGGLIDKPAYLDLVIATRKRYWPLTLSLAAWEKICASP